MKVLVIGGTGSTGSYIVKRLLELDHEVRVLSRHAEDQDKSSDAEMVSGSITDADSIKSAADGMDGVVIIVESSESDDAPNSPEAVHHQGIVHVIDAVRDQHSHIVLVTQIYITRPEAYPEVANVIAARKSGEEVLRASGVPYTIVRPSWLTDDAGGQQAIRFEQGDTGEGSVARADVAEVCVEALLTAEAQGKTFEIYNEPGGAPTDWSEVFSHLSVDQ
jgi:uncharacterized protein YbjT (DUF2867 family)